MSSKFSKTALLAAAGLLVLAVPATAGDVVKRQGDKTIVKAPTTRVETSPSKTKVNVRAPYSKVDVDTGRNKVRIRVPYFNRTITW